MEGEDMTPSVHEQQRVVEKHMAAFNEKDLTGFLEHQTEDVVIHGGLDRYEGADGVERFAGRWAETFPDISVTPEDLFTAEDRTAARWRVTGTHEGEFLGIDPSDEEIEFTGLSIYRFEDGRIAEWWIEADYTGVLQQLDAIEPRS